MRTTQENIVSGTPRAGEIEEINKFTVRPMSEDEVYVFSITLCDNEIDRDYERFSTESLSVLANLFIGKTGIFDHSLRSEDQTARIFSCLVKTDSTRKTSIGEPYTYLTARAYMPRNEKNRSLIEEIDAGIKKETSVGCAVGKSICSICHKDVRKESCNHLKGHLYSGKICHRILSEPKDAYEWSFVAVPAQKEAGVTKKFEGDIKKTVKMLCNSSDDVILSKSELSEIYKYIEELSKMAKEGEEYRTELICDTIRMGAIALPDMKGESLSKICSTLSLDELKELKAAFCATKRAAIPQLALVKDTTQTDENNQFKI